MDAEQHRDPAEDANPLRIPPPARGRVHAHRRRVQFADVSPAGRLRFDAIARMLQDISDEDTTDAGFPPDEVWVVRRVELSVARFPVSRDVVTVSTWGSGVGGRWAERRIRIADDAGADAACIDAVALWVHLDATGRPARLPARFHEVYGEVIGGRRVRARLRHRPPPGDAAPAPFPLRVTDFDPMGHVNNAVSWVPVEDALLARRELRAPLRVSMEYPSAIDRGDRPGVVVRDVDDGFALWVTVGDRVCSSAQLSTGSGASA